MRNAEAPGTVGAGRAGQGSGPGQCWTSLCQGRGFLHVGGVRTAQVWGPVSTQAHPHCDVDIVGRGVPTPRAA